MWFRSPQHDQKEERNSARGQAQMEAVDSVIEIIRATDRSEPTCQAQGTPFLLLTTSAPTFGEPSSPRPGVIMYNRAMGCFYARKPWLGRGFLAPNKLGKFPVCRSACLMRFSLLFAVESVSADQARAVMEKSPLAVSSFYAPLAFSPCFCCMKP